MDGMEEAVCGGGGERFRQHVVLLGTITFTPSDGQFVSRTVQRTPIPLRLDADTRPMTLLERNRCLLRTLLVSL